MRKTTSLLIGLSLALVACKSSRESGAKSENTAEVTTTTTTGPSSSSGSNENTVQTENWNREQAKLGPDSFRLVVTFISIGAGTDPDARALLDKYLLDYKSRGGKSLKYIMIPWGREGEVDCCFTLEELNASEQKDFIEGLRDAMKTRELIQVNEYAKNRFK
ncbi:MAG: hypothetical protein JNL88_07580 [Bacteroidia bacterium]|nr:hypothetical protein [Bacteroidia bacterium]